MARFEGDGGNRFSGGGKRDLFGASKSPSSPQKKQKQHLFYYFNHDGLHIQCIVHVLASEVSKGETYFYTKGVVPCLMETYG